RGLLRNAGQRQKHFPGCAVQIDASRAEQREMRAEQIIVGGGHPHYEAKIGDTSKWSVGRKDRTPGGEIVVALRAARTMALIEVAPIHDGLRESIRLPVVHAKGREVATELLFIRNVQMKLTSGVPGLHEEA